MRAGIAASGIRPAPVVEADLRHYGHVVNHSTPLLVTTPIDMADPHMLIIYFGAYAPSLNGTQLPPDPQAFRIAGTSGEMVSIWCIPATDESYSLDSSADRLNRRGLWVWHVNGLLTAVNHEDVTSNNTSEWTTGAIAHQRGSVILGVAKITTTNSGVAWQSDSPLQIGYTGWAGGIFGAGACSTHQTASATMTEISGMKGGSRTGGQIWITLIELRGNV